MAATQTRQTPVGSGQRDRYIYLVPIIQSVGSAGFPVETDGTPIGLWAYKSEMDGQERLAAGQLSAPYTTRWEVDYLPAIDPDLVEVPKAFLLTYEGRRFDITAAVHIGRRAGVSLMTIARQG